MTYRFLSPARLELTEAMSFYDNAVPGLGVEFLDEVERTIHRILHQPEAWTRVSPNHRRCRLRRFPYGLIYAIEQNEVIIVAVFHLHRHPDSWKNRK